MLWNIKEDFGNVFWKKDKNDCLQSTVPKADFAALAVDLFEAWKLSGRNELSPVNCQGLCQSHQNDSEKVHDAKNCDVADDDLSSERIDETLNEHAAKRYDELLESRRQSDMKNVFDLFCIEDSAAAFCKMKFVFQKLESQERTDELGQNGAHGGSGHAELESDDKKQIKNKI